MYLSVGKNLLSAAFVSVAAVVEFGAWAATVATLAASIPFDAMAVKSDALTRYVKKSSRFVFAVNIE